MHPRPPSHGPASRTKRATSRLSVLTFFTGGGGVCAPAGEEWAGGFDTSGHCFLVNRSVIVVLPDGRGTMRRLDDAQLPAVDCYFVLG